jgi:rsbT co-antagonist protein RsbR
MQNYDLVIQLSRKDDALSTGKYLAAPLNEKEKVELQLFWDVYGRHYEDVIAQIQAGVAERPELRALFEPAPNRPQYNDTRQRIEEGIGRGDWSGYIEYMVALGAYYAVSNIRLATWFGALHMMRSIITRLLMTAYADSPDTLERALNGMSKYLELSMAAICETYVATKEETILKQREAILELSTPVLPLTDGLLIMPIVGVVDTYRAQQLTHVLLYAIREHRARIVVMDITGVPVVDSRVANHFIQSVDAARLMGAKVILTGLSPEVAQALVTVGVNLETITTRSDLQSGIEAAYRRLHYKIVKGNSDAFGSVFDDKD